jgi:hypothetical protein
VTARGIVLLAAALAAGGWYVLRDDGATSSPTPAAAATAAPQPGHAMATAPQLAAHARAPRPEAPALATPERTPPGPPAPPATTVADRRDMLVAQVRASAPASEPWMADARQLVDGADVECRRDGCVATITYTDELAFELDDEKITSSEAFKAFPGWRHRAIATDDAGRVTATWFFMNPADAE